MVETLIMQAFNGISLSSILFLAAVGLAVTFGLMHVINMAHGEFIMVGAYTAYVVQNAFSGLGEAFGLYVPVALVLSFIIAAAVGAVVEKLIVSRLYGRVADSLLVTWGLSLVLQQLARSIFGSPNVGVTVPGYMEGSLMIGDIALPYTRIWILVIALLCLLALYLFMFRTRFGRTVRAVMQNRPMAAALGVNTRRVDSVTFALGSGLAGLAGCALTWIGLVGPSLGQNYITQAFMTVVVGGVGSVFGSVFGAGFIGIGQSIFEFLTDASLGQALIFLAVIVLLQFRPKGIFSVSSRSLEDE